MRRTILAAVLLVGTVLLPAPPNSIAAASAVRPTLTVSPRAGLVDDQDLLIRVRNFTAADWLVLETCPAGANPQRGGRCDYLASVYPGPAGNVRVRRGADAIIDQSGGPYDCRTQPC